MHVTSADTASLALRVLDFSSTLSMENQKGYIEEGYIEDKFRRVNDGERRRDKMVEDACGQIRYRGFKK